MHRNNPNHSLAFLKVGSNTLHNTCIEIIQIILLAAGIPLLQKPQRNNHKTSKIWKIKYPSKRSCMHQLETLEGQQTQIQEMGSSSYLEEL